MDASSKYVVIWSAIIAVGVTLFTVALIFVSGGLEPEFEDLTIAEDALEINFDLNYGAAENRAAFLGFRAEITSNHSDTLSGYAFVYATDESTDPPLRSIAPPRVLSQMNPERRFHINHASEGYELLLAPGDTVQLSGGVPIPSTWHDDTPIESDRFSELTFYILDDQSRLLYERSWPMAVE